MKPSGNSRDFSGEHTAEGLRKFVGESVGRFKEMETLLDCEAVVTYTKLSAKEKY